MNKTTTAGIYWRRFNTSADIVLAVLHGFIARNTKESKTIIHPPTATQATFCKPAQQKDQARTQCKENGDTNTLEHL